MSINDNKRPISPAELFQKLMAGNFKQIQCVNEVAQIHQQRQILISLISQYRLEITRRMEQFQKLEKLVIIRNRLRGQLQRLREQRISINKDIEYQIEKSKLTRAQANDQAHLRAEIEDIRYKVGVLQLRLRELTEYCLKIERQNANLEKQNIIAKQYNIRTATTSDLLMGSAGQACCKGVNWRQRLQARRMQTQRTNINLRNIVREREERSMMQAQRVEQQIAQRNRQRMASFQQKMRRQY